MINIICKVLEVGSFCISFYDCVISFGKNLFPFEQWKRNAAALRHKSSPLVYIYATDFALAKRIMCPSGNSINRTNVTGNKIILLTSKNIFLYTKDATFADTPTYETYNLRRQLSSCINISVAAWCEVWLGSNTHAALRTVHGSLSAILTSLKINCCSFR